MVHKWWLMTRALLLSLVITFGFMIKRRKSNIFFKNNKKMLNLIFFIDSKTKE